MHLTRPRRRQQRILSDIPLTPLIDTALTLLVIFMITTPMMQNVIKVNLPHGSAQEGNGLKQELIVYIDALNVFYLDGKKMSAIDIVSTLRTACIGKSNQTVFIQADEKAQYGTVIELIDSIKVISGIEHVALATQ